VWSQSRPVTDDRIGPANFSKQGRVRGHGICIGHGASRSRVAEGLEDSVHDVETSREPILAFSGWFILQAAVIGAVLKEVPAKEIIGIGVDFTACTMLPVLKDGTPLMQIERFRPILYFENDNRELSPLLSRGKGQRLSNSGPA
jgi:hypothetical protein